MPLFVCGLNHKTAPLAERERLAISLANVNDALSSLTAEPAIDEAVILSTCNRCEVYAIAEDETAVMNWLNKDLVTPSQDASLYRYSEEAAMMHLVRVASGLDSMVLGEPQIFGQVKQAYTVASSFGAVGPHLNDLFQYAFSVTKKIRTDTSIGEYPVSVSYAALNLAKCVFSDLSKSKLLLIGAGETIELAANHFYEQGVTQMITANRTPEKAHALAEQFGGVGIGINELPEYLSNVDIILSATASTTPILTKLMLEVALRGGRRRPMFIVDMAVPRDVEPEASGLQGVYLYNVDDLEQMTRESLDKRKEAALQAEKIAEQEVVRYLSQSRHGEFVGTLRSYRNQVERLREKEIEKALCLLDAGECPRSVLEGMAHSITNKLMHSPSVQLRQAGSTGRRDFLEVAKQLLGLSD